MMRNISPTLKTEGKSGLRWMSLWRLLGRASSREKRKFRWDLWLDFWTRLIHRGDRLCPICLGILQSSKRPVNNRRSLIIKRLEVDSTNSVIFIFGNFLFGIEPAYANA